jgi:hypothetical protein
MTISLGNCWGVEVYKIEVTHLAQAQGSFSLRNCESHCSAKPLPLFLRRANWEWEMVGMTRGKGRSAGLGVMKGTWDHRILLAPSSADNLLRQSVPKRNLRCLHIHPSP